MRYLRPFESRQRRLVFGGPHIDPDDVTQLDARIGRQLDLLAEPARLRLGRHLGALPGHVVLPAVIGAAQPVLLVAPEPERHPAVGTELVDHAHAALGVAKRQQPFGKHLDPHRRTIRLRYFRREQRRNPITPEQVADRRARPALGQGVVLLARGHSIGSIPFSLRAPGQLACARQGPSLATAALAKELSTTPSTLASFFSIRPSSRKNSRSFLRLVTFTSPSGLQ